MQHINQFRLYIPLPRLGLDVYLEGIQPVCKIISDDIVGIVADRCWQPTIIPVIFWKMYFYNYLKILITCCLGFDQKALTTSKKLVLVKDISE